MSPLPGSTPPTGHCQLPQSGSNLPRPAQVTGLDTSSALRQLTPTRRGYAEGAEMLCELAEKLMRSGHEPRARQLWQQARADSTGGSPDRDARSCHGDLQTGYDLQLPGRGGRT